MCGSAEFVLFGGGHLAVLALLLLLSLAVSRVARVTRVTRLAAVIAWLLLGQEVVKLFLFVGIYDVAWKHALPLALCRINEFLCAFMLLRRSYRAFEVAYFWAMAGSVTALITPDLPQGLPDPRFIAFFFGHGLAVLAVLYGIFGYGFRPRLRSVGFALAVTAAYAFLIAGINLLLDTNYLFLRAKPQGASIMDFFGPWPYYIFGTMGLAVALCFLAYLPFVFMHRDVTKE